MSKQSSSIKTRSLLTQILRIFAVVIVIVLVTVAIIAGIGWWAGWQTEEKFKAAIQIAGLMLIGVGFLGISGNRAVAQKGEVPESKSAASDDSWVKSQRSLQEFAQRFSFLLIMFAAGGLCLVIGWLM